MSLEDRQAIHDLLINAGLLLDEGRFMDWAALFAENAEYAMLFKSKEIGGVDDYLVRLDKKQLLDKLVLLPRYVIDRAKRLHMVSNIRVEINGNTANSRSSFTVYRTTEDGKTNLYAVGHSEDSVIKRDNKWLFLKRKVILDTRMLEAHTHMPLQ